MLTGFVLVLGQSPLQAAQERQSPLLPSHDPTETHVAFLEVGCSDFNTAAQLTNLTGISVEVIPTYLERIPDRPGLRKVNAAASNETGTEVAVYWTDPRAIEPTAEPDFLAARGMTCTASVSPSGRSLSLPRSLKSACRRSSSQIRRTSRL